LKSAAGQESTRHLSSPRSALQRHCRRPAIRRTAAGFHADTQRMAARPSASLGSDQQRLESADTGIRCQAPTRTAVPTRPTGCRLAQPEYRSRYCVPAGAGNNHSMDAISRQPEATEIRLWRRALRRIGVDCAPGETPLALAERLRTSDPALAPYFDPVVRLFLLARYAPDNTEHLAALRAAVAKLPRRRSV
jgi:hypothetical protein